jgi:tetratricopeptide (TPR) repeat protein
LDSGRHSNGKTLLLTCFLLSFRLGAQQDALGRAASLDAEHKCAEAEGVYQALLNAGSPSSALLNNLGYHSLSCGSLEKARGAFEDVLKMNPSHRNANLELTRLAVERKEPAAALSYLSHIRTR